MLGVQSNFFLGTIQIELCQTNCLILKEISNIFVIRFGLRLVFTRDLPLSSLEGKIVTVNSHDEVLIVLGLGSGFLKATLV